MKTAGLVCVALFAGSAAGTSLKRHRLDINQKVYIENAPVLGDGAGEDALNECTGFADAHVSNADAPKVKVCGTGIKMTVFMRGRCEEYYEHTQVVGKCDTGMPASTCDTYSPDVNAEFGAYQSYKIE